MAALGLAAVLPINFRRLAPAAPQQSMYFSIGMPAVPFQRRYERRNPVVSRRLPQPLPTSRIALRWIVIVAERMPGPAMKISAPAREDTAVLPNESMAACNAV